MASQTSISFVFIFNKVVYTGEGAVSRTKRSFESAASPVLFPKTLCGLKRQWPEISGVGYELTMGPAQNPKRFEQPKLFALSESSADWI